MKKFNYLAIVLMALVFAGCPENPNLLEEIETGDVSELSPKTVIIHGNVNINFDLYENVEFGIIISTKENELMTNDAVLFKVEDLIGNEFKIKLANLQPQSSYYYCAWLSLGEEKIKYGSIKSFTTPPAPAKAFSVSPSNYVCFSSGNLQYQASTNKWRFAENQTDYIGNANSNISLNYDGWIDLFGWSTINSRFGLSTSIDVYNDIDFTGDFIDWGTNQIGDDALNTWRTLTKYEWRHLCFERSNSASLIGVAQVNNVNGLILLPDDWVCPNSLNFKVGFYDTNQADLYAAHQTLTKEQWMMLEKTGAVFLPACGSRDGKSVSHVQYWGSYWSSSPQYLYAAHSLYFYSYGVYVSDIYRNFGYSVRLVQDVK